jgi:excisionase family DNA binding protein
MSIAAASAPAVQVVELPAAYLGFDDAALYIGVSRPTIERMVANGKLVPYRPCPGRIVLSRAGLDSYMQSVANGRCRRRGGRPQEQKQERKKPSAPTRIKSKRPIENLWEVYEAYRLSGKVLMNFLLGMAGSRSKAHCRMMATTATIAPAF